MKNLGYLLLTVGVLGGSYFAVVEAESVAVGPFLGMLALGVAGVALARYATHQASRDVTLVSANIEAIEKSLVQIVESARAFDADKDSIDVYELRHHIDREFPDELDTFVQARESIAHGFGLQAYADVMNPFAAGERYLNRVWSTSTDGYVDEAHTYITKAHEQFEEALQVFKGLRRA